MESVGKLDNIYWQDLSENEKIKKLLKTGHLADCKFVVGPNKDETEIIYGHKIMFALESPVFEKHFDGNFLEGESMPEIRIEDFNPADFRHFCFLIYSKNAGNYNKIFAKYCIEEIIEIYRICHKYMVSSILKNCLKFIQNSLNTLHLAKMILLFELAHELNEKVLLTSVEKAISGRTVVFDTKLFDLSPENFYNYIAFLKTLGHEKIPAAIMFNWIYDYFLTNNLMDKDNKKETTQYKTEKVEDKESFCCINKFLEFVDFNNMAAAEFIAGPGKAKIFDWKTKYELIIKIIQKTENSHKNYYR